ncbi:MAG: hypothetical protein J0L75_05015 [Spirochaetes bacterium]|nr:hypothetical protein [Spirochaetota bacterium]
MRRTQHLFSWRFPRRAIGFILVMAALWGQSPNPMDPWHRALWGRFMGVDGVLLDYAGPSGEVDLPTPEDCRLGKPNALAWWSPIENGAFFTGLYLAGLCRRHEQGSNAQDRERARVLARGLLSLARTRSDSGFIARGLAPDGMAFHTVTSSDQIAPWFYGLWRYLRSGLPHADERVEILGVFRKTADDLYRGGWQIPTGPGMPAGSTFGNWVWKDFRGAPRLLFVCRAMADLTGDPVWEDRYRRYCAETPLRALTNRLAVIAEGMGRDVRGEDPALAENCWVYVVSQAMVAALLEMETDSATAQAYRKSLEATAAQVYPLLADIRFFRSLPVSVDWRSLKYWKVQASPKEAEALAARQYIDWMSPGRMHETRFMREPLCAAWISMFATNAEYRRRALWTLGTARALLNPEKLTTSLFFAGECAWYEAVARGASSLTPSAPPVVAHSEGAPDWVDDREIPPWLGARFSHWSSRPTRCRDKFAVVGAPGSFEGAVYLSVKRGLSTLASTPFQITLSRGAKAFLVVHQMGGYAPGAPWIPTTETLSWCPNPQTTNIDRVYENDLAAGSTVTIPSHTGRGETSYGIPHGLALVPNIQK